METNGWDMIHTNPCDFLKGMQDRIRLANDNGMYACIMVALGKTEDEMRSRCDQFDSCDKCIEHWMNEEA